MKDRSVPTSRESLPPAVLYDRDGTLASVAHVAPTPENGRSWYAYNAAMVFDAPVPRVAQLLRATPPGVTRIMTSGRAAGDHPGDWRRFYRMVDWLTKHDLPIDVLLMRRGGDQRPDHIVKAEMYDTLIDGAYDVLYVVDDRPQVCDVWRSRGLRVIQVSDPGIMPPITNQENHS